MDIKYKCKSPEELWELCEIVNNSDKKWSYMVYTRETIFKEWESWNGLIYDLRGQFTRTRKYDTSKSRVVTTMEEFCNLTGIIVNPWVDSKLKFSFLNRKKINERDKSW